MQQSDFEESTVPENRVRHLNDMATGLERQEMKPAYKSGRNNYVE